MFCCNVQKSSLAFWEKVIYNNTRCCAGEDMSAHYLYKKVQSTVMNGWLVSLPAIQEGRERYENY